MTADSARAAAEVVDAAAILCYDWECTTSYKSATPKALAHLQGHSRPRHERMSFES